MIVTAPLVTVKTENSRVVYLYRGDVVPSDATKDSVENLKSLGYVSDESAASKPASKSSK